MSRSRQLFTSHSRQRPYYVENTGSRPITEVKQHWAWLVLGWETAWEHQVLLSFLFFFPLVLSFAAVAELKLKEGNTLKI